MAWNEQRVVIDGPVKMADGYGHMTMNLIKSFCEAGYDVRCRRHWTHTDLTYVPDMVRNLVEADLACRVVDMPQVGMRMSTPESFSVCPTPFKVGYSMFEFTKLPTSWASGSESANLVMVPSEWCKELWVNAGVQAPVEVNQLGVDPLVFTAPERKAHKGVFTFVMTGTISERKAPWLAWQAFAKAFPNRDDVRLIIKTPAWLPVGRGPDPKQVPVDDHRIQIINDVWADHQMVELLHSADCFLYPTRSEGFGLSPCEAMSTGLPVICTGATSCTEFMKPEHSYPLEIEGWEQVPSHWGDIGGYTIPSVEHLTQLMKHVEANREEAVAKGKKAAAFIRENLTWAHNVTRFHDILQKYV
jgi:glycosyltransferase involved in cell wall biosynthesis